MAPTLVVHTCTQKKNKSLCATQCVSVWLLVSSDVPGGPAWRPREALRETITLSWSGKRSYARTWNLANSSEMGLIDLAYYKCVAVNRGQEQSTKWQKTVGPVQGCPLPWGANEALWSGNISKQTEHGPGSIFSSNKWYSASFLS